MKMKSEIPPIRLVIHEGIEEFESEMQRIDEGTGGGRLLSRDSATALSFGRRPVSEAFSSQGFDHQTPNSIV
jgi:hypothetical protein